MISLASEIEETLEKGQIKDLEVFSDETNKVLIGRIDSLDVIVKPKTGLYKRQLRIQIKTGKELERERSAYLLAHQLEIASPVVVIRNVGRRGLCSVQDMIPHIKKKHLVGYQAKRAQRLRKIALLDAVIGNMDRHLGNIVSHDYPIDHGLSFPGQGSTVIRNQGHYQAMELNEGAALTETEIYGLEKLLDDQPLHLRLRQIGLSGLEVNRTLQRVKALLDNGMLPHDPEVFIMGDPEQAFS